MHTREFADFLESSKQYKTIPIVETFFSDTVTPVSIFQSLKEEAAYILESKEPNSDWSRYSFIGLHPFMKIKGQDTSITLEDHNKVLYTSKSLNDVIEQANALLQVKKLDKKIGFTGGAVGYLSYDFISNIEKVPLHPGYQGENTVHLLYCESIIVMDHKKNEIHFIQYVRLTSKETEEELHAKYQQASSVISNFITLLRKTENTETLLGAQQQRESLAVSSNYTKVDFIDHVEKIKNYITAGDVFQCVLSQRFEMEAELDGFDVYRVLRKQNPSPYLFYLKFEEMELIGSSPERLIQIQDNMLEIHPIAGTRKRGADENEDKLLAEELMQDEKEQAEHFMLVDLARNDLGRVAKYGSVHTPIIKQLVYFSKVMHLISIVKGELAPSHTPVNALLASFPAGTVSGAPKVRAMQILQQLESTARNTYAGAICYIGFDGNVDSCITIRTIQKQQNKFYIQAGAGIVADSVPESEWEETKNKAAALIETVQIANTLFHKKSKGGLRYV
ncbi:anthranilate synthase component I [Sutcliffiella halmapala]|uniref:anthranilate synthase component I n=1 Tax=Sutcliffiella halmapala TaxID=79882 RepID=UPI000995C52F|nr:anthranilate synthase component I [Sutcliffiella halmapala]